MTVHANSLEAYASSDKNNRVKVMAYLIATGGSATTEQAVKESGVRLKDNFAPSVTWLRQRGYVREAAEPYINERNRKCTVWVPTEAGIDWFNRL